MSNRLTGKVAAVTGGNQGIGRAIAEALGQAGADIVVADLDPNRSKDTVAAVEQLGRKALNVKVNVADGADTKAMVDQVLKEWGKVDILVNNAGVTGNCPAKDLDLATWNRVLAVNQTGTLLCAQAAAARMARSHGGSIVNLSSIYGLVAAPNRVAYSATKAAVIMMTKALAVEWAGLGIRVNCVAPGYVETPGTSELVEKGVIDLAALRRIASR